MPTSPGLRATAAPAAVAQAPRLPGLDTELRGVAPAATRATESVVVGLVTATLAALGRELVHLTLRLPVHPFLGAHAAAIDLAVSVAELVTGGHRVLHRWSNVSSHE